MSRTLVFERDARSILTSTGGYLAGFTYSLQPYVGCQFSCVYCYVRELAVQRANPYRLPWSRWISPKRNAPLLLRHAAQKGRLRDASIFCASATDPYVPIESRMRLTRGCLEVMAEHSPAALLLQTRSPLVARDIDVLTRIPAVRVSMTIATDDETVRRVFEPNAPATKLRIDALRLLREAGVRTQAAIAPLLPCDPDRLAAMLDPVVDRVVVDDFFEGDGAGGRRSGAALTRLRELGHGAFAERGYAEATLSRLRERLGAERVLRSQAGFVP